MRRHYVAAGALAAALALAAGALAGNPLAARRGRTAEGPAAQRSQAAGGTPAASRALSAPAPSLAAALQDYLAQLPGTWGLYLLDLSDGETLALNADRYFPAASTVKLPLVMMVVEAWARGEADPDSLMVLTEADWQEGTGILIGSKAGDAYSLRTLAELAITHSDNTAAHMLLRRFGRQRLFAYMRSLGGAPQWREGLTWVTPREMGLYLQELYRGRRLPREARDLVLGWLTRTAFPIRLRAGVPAEVPVAHKIGTLPGAVHDVGIVLDPENPFILAVMSSGAPEKVAEAAIAAVAALAYNHMAGP